MPEKLSIQICGPHEDEENNATECAIRTVRHSGSIAVEVATPSKLMDEAQTESVVSAVFDEIYKIGDNVVVDTIHLNSLRFTCEGAQAINVLLLTYSTTIQIVEFIDIVNHDSQGEEVLGTLMTAFQDSSLVAFNLSRNFVPAMIWEFLNCHQGLEQLVLREVLMEEDSFESMGNHWNFSQLQDLNIDAKPMMSARALNRVLPKCNRLVSLRCVASMDSPHNELPWRGLADLVNHQKRACPLEHLAMEGSVMDPASADLMGMVLGNLPMLKSLNLRRNRLTDKYLQPLVQGILVSKPPLEWLCLSQNHIQQQGASLIASISLTSAILSTLQCVAVEDNHLNDQGAMNLYAAFSSKDANSFSLLVGGNRFDMGQLAFFMASASHRFGVERDILSAERDKYQQSAQEAEQCLSKVLTSQGKVDDLQRQVQILKQERDALLKAFAVLGSAEQARQHVEISQRIDAIEERVFGESSSHSNSHRRNARREASTRSLMSQRGGRSLGPELNPPEYTKSPLTRKTASGNASITGASHSPKTKYPSRMPLIDQVGKADMY